MASLLHALAFIAALAVIVLLIYAILRTTPY